MIALEKLRESSKIRRQWTFTAIVMAMVIAGGLGVGSGFLTEMLAQTTQQTLTIQCTGPSSFSSAVTLQYTQQDNDIPKDKGGVFIVTIPCGKEDKLVTQPVKIPQGADGFRLLIDITEGSRAAANIDNYAARTAGSAETRIIGLPRDTESRLSIPGDNQVKSAARVRH